MSSKNKGHVQGEILLCWHLHVAVFQKELPCFLSLCLIRTSAE